MFDIIFEFILGIFFGVIFLIFLLFFLTFTKWCVPLTPNNAVRDSSIKIDPQPINNNESIHWINSIFAFESIHKLIEDKVTQNFQTSINEISLSTELNTIVQNVNVTKTYIPNFAESSIKTSKDKNTKMLINTFDILFDSPITVYVTAFALLSNQPISAKVTITHVDPIITIFTPSEEGPIKCNIDFGVDPEIKVDSTEPNGAATDLIKAVFTKIFRRLDVQFEEEEEENKKEEENKNQNQNEKREQEEDNDETKRKPNLIIPHFPSFIIESVHNNVEKVTEITQTIPTNRKFAIKKGDRVNVIPFRRQHISSDKDKLALSENLLKEKELEIDVIKNKMEKRAKEKELAMKKEFEEKLKEKELAMKKEFEGKMKEKEIEIKNRTGEEIKEKEKELKDRIEKEMKEKELELKKKYEDLKNENQNEMKKKLEEQTKAKELEMKKQIENDLKNKFEKQTKDNEKDMKEKESEMKKIFDKQSKESGNELKEKELELKQQIEDEIKKKYEDKAKESENEMMKKFEEKAKEKEAEMKKQIESEISEKERRAKERRRRRFRITKQEDILSVPNISLNTTFAQTCEDDFPKEESEEESVKDEEEIVLSKISSIQRSMTVFDNVVTEEEEDSSDDEMTITSSLKATRRSITIEETH